MRLALNQSEHGKQLALQVIDIERKKKKTAIIVGTFSLSLFFLHLTAVCSCLLAAVVVHRKAT